MDGLSESGEMLFDEVAVMDDDADMDTDAVAGASQHATGVQTRSALSRMRSMSDGGGTPSKLLSPSPHIVEAARRVSKDDSSLREPTTVFASSISASQSSASISTPPVSTSTPVTPHRAEFSRRGLSLQMPLPSGSDLAYSPASSYQQQQQQLFHQHSRSPYARPVAPPLSPKLDPAHAAQQQQQAYASPPTNILPRRSRGLDFSRAATSLHHSMLAEQSSPDSSPTIGGRGINIPGGHHRRSGDFGGAEMTSSSLWSVVGHGGHGHGGGAGGGGLGGQDRMHISSSLGSAHPPGSESSTSSDEDDLMDEDTDEPYVTTPQVARVTTPVGPSYSSGFAPWPNIGNPNTSPAMNGLRSFQQRQRARKQPKKKKLRAPLGLGFASGASAAAANLSRSPPSNGIAKDIPAAHSRRESISWQANQLHISGAGSEGEEGARAGDGLDGVLTTPGRDRSVIRRVVARRQNLMPKTKNFARIRAALAEESAPVESEFRREAEVVRQVRESDVDLEPRVAATTTHSSPNIVAQESLDDIPEDDMMEADGAAAGLGLSSSFKQQAMRNSKGRNFWDTFSESGSAGGGPQVTPPPYPPGAAILPRGSSSGVSEDASMDSPSLGASAGLALGLTPSNESQRSASDTPLGLLLYQTASQGQSGTPGSAGGGGGGGGWMGPQPPSAAEITRRINSKRRRDDDFDPVSFKRRAVSPGMSVHNSPVMQSPLQRDAAPWGSRPGSTGGDTGGGSNNNSNKVNGGSGATSENGSLAGTPSNGPATLATAGAGGPGAAGGAGAGAGAGGGAGAGAGAGAGTGTGTGAGPGRVNGNKGRIGYQGMVDTNDGMMRMSIE